MENLKAIVEALLFVAQEPLSPKVIQKLLKDGGYRHAPVVNVIEPTDGEVASVVQDLQALQNAQDQELSAGEIKQVLRELQAAYNVADRGVELVEVGGAFQIRTRAAFSEWVKLFLKPPAERLSKPALETLAIIAYRQPLARIEVEEIRGVDTGGVLKTLLDRRLIRLIGRSDDPGRPLLYGTTQEFLELFGLTSLKDLPTLRDLQQGDHPLAIPGGGQSDVYAWLQEQPVVLANNQDLEVRELIHELDEKVGHLTQLEKDMVEPAASADVSESGV